MQLLVGCKVEGNYYFNCQFICKCLTCTNPENGCENFKPLGKYITQQHIADLLNIELHQLGWILKKYGADKIVEMLEIRGHIVRYEAERNLKFFWIGEIK